MSRSVTDIQNGAIPVRPGEVSPNRPVLTSARFRMDDRYHRYRPTGTPTWLLFFTMAGRGFFRGREDQLHLTKRGELVLYPLGTLQEYGTPKGERWDFHWAHFHARSHWSQWLDLPKLGPGWSLGGMLVTSPRLRHRIAGIFGELHCHVRHGTALRNELALSCLERLLLYTREASSGRLRRPLDGRARHVMEIIAADLSQSLSLTVLAKKVGLSASRLGHLFKAATGQSIHRYILVSRLTEAAKLLELTPSTVSEVAYQLGFSNPFHLSSQFKRHYGVSPKRFRARTIAGR
jgi:AraC family transcriptional regulator, arabinose operon regulatory protein